MKSFIFSVVYFSLTSLVFVGLGIWHDPGAFLTAILLVPVGVLVGFFTWKDAHETY